MVSGEDLRAFWRDCERRRLSPLTVTQYLRQLRRWPSSYSADELRQVVVTETRPSVRHAMICSFRAFCSWLVRCGRPSPCGSLRSGTLISARVRAVSRADCRKLAALDGVEGQVCRVLLCLGLRRAEISAAVLEQDGTMSTIVKGGRVRSFAIPAFLRDDLAAIIGLPPHQIYRAVKRAGAIIGRPQLSPHWLRHAHASMLSAGGATIVEVARSLGHSDPRVSAGYVHSEDEPAQVVLQVIQGGLR